MGGDVLSRILRQETLVHQRLLPLGKLFLLFRQGLDTPRFGFVGLVLQGDVAGIDHRQQFPGFDHLAATGQYLGHASRHFGADLGVGQHFEVAQGFQHDFEVALGRLGHGNQRGWRHRLLFLGLLAASSEQDQGEASEKGVAHHGRMDSSANSSATSSRRRIWCMEAPSIMTSAARGRLL